MGKTSSFKVTLNNQWLLSPARLAEKYTQGYERFKHIQFIDNVITDAIAKGGARLVLSMPPRHGKSWFCSKSLPAWYLSMFPNKNVILASYEATFAATWGRQVRNFMQDHQQELGVNLDPTIQAADRWNMQEGGGMFTTGIGGPITGRGGHLIIIDDPVKNWEEARSELIRQSHIDWFNSTLYTRCEPGASIVVLMTRWHESDLAGYILKEHKDNWTEIRLPALAEDDDVLGRPPGQPLCPERYDKAALEKIRDSIGPNMFASLYQQRPVPLEGDIFKDTMFREFVFSPETARSMEYSFVTVDTAYTDKASNDYTVASAWGVSGGQLYLMDVYRERVRAADVEAPLVSFIQRNCHTRFRGVFIEPKGHGIYLNQQLPRAGVMMPSEDQIKEFFLDRKSDKVIRANNIVPYLTHRAIYYNSAIRNMGDLLAECTSFPRGKHDDFVDTLCDGVKYAMANVNRGLSICDVL